MQLVLFDAIDFAEYIKITAAELDCAFRVLQFAEAIYSFCNCGELTAI
jgi:hypothetical protein